MTRFGTALLIGSFFALGASLAPAYAGPCGDEIVRLETLMRGNNANPDIGPTAKQSIGAQLEHQPTIQSVDAAETKAKKNVDDVLKRARVLNAEGKEGECMDAVQ